MPVAGAALEQVLGKTGEILQDKDYELIQDKLKMISNCGDVVEQIEIGCKVAWKLAKRYKEQLLRLQENNNDVQGGCCSFCKCLRRCIDSGDNDSPSERVASFAVHYIVSAVADQSIKALGLKNANDQKSLVYMLVDLVSRARGPKMRMPECIYKNPNLILPLTTSSQTNLMSSVHNNVTTADGNSQNTTKPKAPCSGKKTASTAPIDHFFLYDFFRAPGIRCKTNEPKNGNNEEQTSPTNIEAVDNEGASENKADAQQDTNKSYLDSSSSEEENNTDEGVIHFATMPYMNVALYGHRWGTNEEIALLEQLQSKKKPCFVHCTDCC